MTRHVVMYSGGVGSWAAAKRVAAQHGTADMTLLFMDTLIEDEDLYRFLDEGSANVGAALVRIAEGRTPWEIFFDERFLGNSRIDPCSKILKRKLGDRWLRDNCDPRDTIVYVGIDWSESHRFDDGDGGGLGPRRAEKGWRYEAPMCHPPFITKPGMLADLRGQGIREPRLYGMGFSHNNCGGFCIKAGIGHFVNYYRHFRDRYLADAAREAAFQAIHGAHCTILRERKGSGKNRTVHPLSLYELARRIDEGEQFDLFDLGGCGCFAGSPKKIAVTAK